MVGQELPILGSASALAYIAFAPKKEWDTLLALLARCSDPHHAVARDAAQASRLIAATRRGGYGLRQVGEIWPHTGSLPYRSASGADCLAASIAAASRRSSMKTQDRTERSVTDGHRHRYRRASSNGLARRSPVRLTMIYRDLPSLIRPQSKAL